MNKKIKNNKISKKQNIAVSVDNLHIIYRGLTKTSIRKSWNKKRKKVH